MLRSFGLVYIFRHISICLSNCSCVISQSVRAVFNSHLFYPSKGFISCLEDFIIKNIFDPFFCIAEGAGVRATNGIATIFVGIHIPQVAINAMSIRV